MKIQTITVTCKRRAGDQDLNSESSPKAMLSGNSLEVQCLGLSASTAGAQSLVRDLRYCKTQGVAKGKKMAGEKKKRKLKLISDYD